MGWLISRQEATSDPDAARRKMLALLGHLDEVAAPENLLMPILVDAMLIVEAYRGARHQISLLPELQRSVDALIRELGIIERTRQWAAAEEFAPAPA